MNILFHMSRLTWKSQFSRSKQHPKIVYTHLAVCTSGILNLFCSRPLTCHWTFAFSAVLITANFDWQPHKRGAWPKVGEKRRYVFLCPWAGKKWNRKTKQAKWENPGPRLSRNNIVGPVCVCPLLGENGKSEVREAEVSDADIPTGVCAAIPWD